MESRRAVAVCGMAYMARNIGKGGGLADKYYLLLIAAQSEYGGKTKFYIKRRYMNRPKEPPALHSKRENRAAISETGIDAGSRSLGREKMMPGSVMMPPEPPVGEKVKNAM